MTSLDPRTGSSIEAHNDADDPLVGPGIDTVEVAAATPDQPQPWAELGLRAEEYQRIRDILGRRPTDAELAMYSVMWSEHCSYKSSKVHLRYFGETTTPEMRERMLAGIGENAGVVDIGGGWAVTFKIESHNHPSYVEPHQGAATGVGGIVRDILAMGARPVAVADSLRFGPADAPDTARVLPGVVSGISFYGNCLGLPNVGGELVFDPVYAGNPLVNALCVGVLRAEDLHLAHASGTGNKVILFGARTGLDGIGGVSVLASETFDGDESGAGRKKLPSVQVGDPFTEKLLIECCLELFAAGLVVGIQDLGGAGLSCATSELASAGDGGMRIELDAVPLRAATMTPAEILASESQERMCAVVTPENVPAFLAVCRKWDIPATVIGEVTAGGRLVITWRGRTVVDVPPRTVAHEGPVYHRPLARPTGQDTMNADTAARLARPTTARELLDTIVRMAASPNLCGRAWVTDQYDRYVRGHTFAAQPSDAGVLRIAEGTHTAVAISTDCNSRYCALDPYAGAQLALAEAYRNVATSGAVPVAVTDCLNFGSPEDPGVMWQFRQAVRGLADGCVALGIPVTGGNVSFYNQTGPTAIHPTPVVGVLGVLDDVRHRIPTGFVAGTEGHRVLLLGTTREELDGSEWAHVAHGHLGGRPPAVDLAAERALATLLTEPIGAPVPVDFAGAAPAGSSSPSAPAESASAAPAESVSSSAPAESAGAAPAESVSSSAPAESVSSSALEPVGAATSAHDLSEGGLAQALVECCLLGGRGAEITLPADIDPFVALFAESPGRVIVTVAPAELAGFTARCAAHGVPVTELGEVTEPDAGLTLAGLGTLGLIELREAWEGTLTSLFR